MSININVQVKGLNELRAGFIRLEDKSDAQMAKALNKGILVLDAEAARQSPVDVGLLRNTREIEKASQRSLQAEVNFVTEYAAAVHQGVNRSVKARSRSGRVYYRKVKNRPNPYAERAVEIKGNRALDIINDTISELIR